jgi:hypothetical protein
VFTHKFAVKDKLDNSWNALALSWFTKSVQQMLTMLMKTFISIVKMLFSVILLLTYSYQKIRKNRHSLAKISILRNCARLMDLIFTEKRKSLFGGREWEQQELFPIEVPFILIHIINPKSSKNSKHSVYVSVPSQMHMCSILPDY